MKERQKKKENSEFSKLKEEQLEVVALTEEEEVQTAQEKAEKRILELEKVIQKSKKKR